MIKINILEKYLAKIERNKKGLKAGISKNFNNCINFSYEEGSLNCFIEIEDFEEILIKNKIYEKINLLNKCFNKDKKNENLIYSCLASYIRQYAWLSISIYEKDLKPIDKHKINWF